MAEKVLFSIAGGIAGSLGSLANEEIGRFLTVGNELKKLIITVSTIQNVILDAEKQQHGSLTVKGWLGELEDILYEADDLLDDVSTEALRRKIMEDTMAKKVRKFFSKSNQLAYRFKIGRKIKAIRERLDAAVDNKRLHPQSGPVEAPIVRGGERYDTCSFENAQKIIGREDDKETIIGWLMNSDIKENDLVLPIVGLGGLGKTTLAKLIFNDKRVEETFEPRIWVYVSKIFVVKDIVKKILEYITKERPSTDVMALLVSELQHKIAGKKYLLVLDDVWNHNQDEWSYLKERLMVGAKGSRILVTSRDTKVAGITSRMKPHVLKGLNNELSWDLFKQVAFRNMEHSENPSIVEMGKKILEKCRGVPLAVKTIGNLLYFKNPETRWSSFINNEFSEIPDDENYIIQTLQLSYDHLPHHLKQCFFYCGLFPKGHTIDKSSIVNLWIAQGFVELEGRNRCLEDIGHDCFMDLLWGSFFQEPEIDKFGDVISCKMHDLMHDLARQVVGSLIIGLDDENVEIDGKTRHISVKKASSAFEASGIRTFLCPEGCLSGVHEEIFTKFKSLRALDLNSRNLTSIPSSIGGLKHLRYLDLSHNIDIEKLPDSITRLQNLQTLNLSCCSNLKELPRDIKFLVNLRHLYLDVTIRLRYMPRGVGQLTNLQTLSSFVLNSQGGVLNSELTSRGCGLWDKSSTEDSPSAGLNELKELNNLRGELVIENLRQGKDFVSEYQDANLKKKSRLHTLNLEWGRNADDNDITSDEMLLEVLQPHPNLKTIRFMIIGVQGCRGGYGHSQALLNWFYVLQISNIYRHCVDYLVSRSFTLASWK